MTTLESNVPMPNEEVEAFEPPKKKSAARSRATKKKSAAPNPAASLLNALKFISVAQKKAGPANMQFAHINGHWAAASDGILTVAHPIDEDLSACPQTLQFIAALSKVGEEMSITQLNPEALAVSSGAFRALVPCVGFDEVPIPCPDPQCAVVDDRLKTALNGVFSAATENAPVAHYAAVLLQAGSAVATNGAILLEAWHGIDLPPNIMIPKAAAVAIFKTGLALTGFGFSQSSATFYFENGAFLKTQLYAERFPPYQRILEVDNVNPWAVPEEFFTAIKAVEAFSPNGSIYFEEGVVFSGVRKEAATTYKLDGLPDKMAFSVKYLLAVKHAFAKAHFMPELSRVFFFGDNIRGVLMGLDLKEQVSYNSEEYVDNIQF